MDALARGESAGRPQQIDFVGFEILAEDTVVDVGCGDGVVCAFAGHLGADVIGLDIDPECLALTEAAMRGVPARSWRGILSDCDPIPLPDACASVVVATEVLEHVEDPQRLAAELVRIGKPGARYLISVPDPTSESILRIVAPGWYWKPPFHRRVFEPRELDALLTTAGLDVQGRTTTGFYSALWWTFRMALGAEPCEPTPDAPLLNHWEEAWDALLKTPRGRQVAAALDRLVPKSQVRIARKPGRMARIGSFFRGPHWSGARWKRRIRDGALHLGGFDLRWTIRRVAPRPEASPAPRRADGIPRRPS